MYKIKKIKEDDELSFDEFMVKYGDQLREGIKKGELSQDLISNLAYMILDYDEWKKWQYQKMIEDIYINIVEFKYMCNGCSCSDPIYEIVDHITFLKEDKDFNHRIEYWNLEELCNKAYRNIYNTGYAEYMEYEMEEEFKPEHLFDWRYHLNNFKKYTKLEDISKLIDKFIL